ncbi:CCDC40 [Scenedesmus sp. PABB004]|nr:CCDC40 [Scenedesmus sp. PABB004]
MAETQEHPGPPAAPGGGAEQQEPAAEAAQMDPDHPMLARAQAALARQLDAKRARVAGELREKQNALSRAKRQREEVGVELYGYQQSLAKLQMGLERAQDGFAALAATRAEQELAQLRERMDGAAATNKAEAQRAEAVQRELDRLGATLQAVEAYNAGVAGEIAVTRRAAAAAEDAVARLEKEETQRSLQAQLELHGAQLAAQRLETRAAKETLAEAEREMEGVRFEKKALLAQWRGSVNAVQKRDVALAAIQASMTAARGEQLGGVVRRVKGEAEFAGKQAAAAVEKTARLQAQLAKLVASLESTEDEAKRGALEGKASASEADAVERATQRVFAELRTLQGDVLRTLSEQTSAEASSAKTAADVRSLRAAAEDEELRIAGVQNELARLAVDALHTAAHNERLSAALELLDGELKDKDAAIAKCEVELKRRADEIERKTREADGLNRKLERLVAAQPEAINTGPLEATIHNLGRDIEAKGREGQELQRRWIARQTELAENAALAETLARHRAEVTVLTQKRARAERALAGAEAEARGLRAAAARLQVDLGRINALIAQHTGLKAALEEEQLQIEGRALSELRALEESSAGLAGAIQEAQHTKRCLLDDLLEAERQIMLAERKIQLEKEMQARRGSMRQGDAGWPPAPRPQEVLDPTVGEGVVAAMKREVHRMELRHADLLRTQERLMQELERALSKHEIIGVKALAARSRFSPSASSSRSSSGRSSPAARSGGSSRSPSPNAAASQATAARQLAEFRRSIRETDAEAAATASRLAALQEARGAAEAARSGAADAFAALAAQQAELRDGAARAAAARHTVLLSTTQLQRMAKALEDVAAGRHKRGGEGAPGGAALADELSRTADKQARLAAALRGLQDSCPALHEELGRIAAHAAAAAAWLPGGAGAGGAGAGSGENGAVAAC